MVHNRWTKRYGKPWNHNLVWVRFGYRLQNNIINALDQYKSIDVSTYIVALFWWIQWGICIFFKITLMETRLRSIYPRPQANDTLHGIKITTSTTSYKIVKYGNILKYEQIAHEDVNDKLCFANQIYHKLDLQSMSPLRTRRTFSIRLCIIEQKMDNKHD